MHVEPISIPRAFVIEKPPDKVRHGQQGTQTWVELDGKFWLLLADGGFQLAAPSSRYPRTYLDGLVAKALVAKILAHIRERRQIMADRHQQELDQRAAVAQASADRERAQAALRAKVESGKYPYFVRFGRYGIPRVWRIEKTKRGLLRSRIYDRKNDRWGKTLIAIGSIVGVMDEAGFAAWKQSLGTVYELAEK